MHLFFSLLGIASTFLYYTNSSVTTLTAIHSYANVQDSIPPRKGTAVVSELGTNRKINSEKVGNLPPKYKKELKRKEREAAKANKLNESNNNSSDTDPFASNKPTPVNRNNKDTSILTIPEQIELLARKEEKPVENKVHPSLIQSCALAFDKVDEFTGRKDKGLYPRHFFHYTPENYRKHLKNKEFINCDGFLSESTGNLMALNLTLTIASKDASSKFGAIKPNSSLVLHTIDDKEYYLITYAGAEPELFDYQTIYKCSFAINKSDVKKLKQAEIDRAKITFHRGVFNYDVYYLDFLSDQLKCFEK